MRLVAEGLRFPEGPVAMSDGSVLLVEIERRTLSRVLPDGTVEVVAECGGGPNGAALGPDGRMFICNNGGFEWIEADGKLYPGEQPANYLGGRIERVNIQTGEFELLYTECDGIPLKGPNDIVFDETGKNVVKPMVLYQVQDGEYVVVAPEAYAEADVRWPTPPWSQR